MRVAAGILHFRYWPDVRRTIDALLAQSRPPDDILLLDHASGDGSAEKLRDAYPQLDVLVTEDNRGPAGGLNRLIAALLERDVDAVFPLPDDMELAPHALEHLTTRLAEQPALGAVAPLIAHERERDLVFCAGGYLDPRTWDLDFLCVPPRVSDWQGRPPQECDFLGTGGILLRAAPARELGPMPEHFHHNLDDVDYTIRLRRRGWKLECVPASLAWQDLGDRSQNTLLPPADPYLMARNRLGLIARNAPRRMVGRELVRMVRWLVRDAIRPRSGSRADLKPRVRGMVDFCRGRWGPPPGTP